MILKGLSDIALIMFFLIPVLGLFSKKKKNKDEKDEKKTIEFKPGDKKNRPSDYKVKLKDQVLFDGSSSIGKYFLVGFLGKGGMGEIYKARSPEGRIVAIKIITAESNFDKDRFSEELKIISILSHNYIVKLIDSGIYKGRSYIVMDYIDSINLRQFMKMEKMTIQKTVNIIIMVCEALKYAHQKNIIHLDIKPENILITKTGIIKVIDFGISKVRKEDYSSTLTNTIMGTPSYMSPEQKKGLKNIDSRSDIYSVGVLLYEMISGESPSGLLRLDLIPEDIQLIIKKSIAFNREERYSDIDLMLVDLIEYKQKGDIQQDQDSLKAITSVENVREALLKHLYRSPKTHHEGYDYFVMYLPAFGIGGNYYDITNIDDRYFGILVGNVFDKPDISSAIYLTMIRSFFRILSDIDPDPAMVLSSVNRYISNEDFDMFAMFSYIVIDKKRNVLSFSNAGYRPIYYYSSEADEFQEIKTDGIGLGIVQESKYSRIDIKYNKGDIFALCSSGIIDACNIEGIPFGKEKFLEIIYENRAKESLDIAYMIKSNVLKYTRGVAQNDDITLALIKIV